MTPSPVPTPRGSPLPVPWLARQVPLLGASAAALLLAGCASDAPTEPKAVRPGPAAAVASGGAISQERLSALHTGMDDATARLLPSLSDAVAAAQLRVTLRDLSTQLAAGDVARARRSLARAREAVRDGDAGSAPDLVAIELMLNHAAATLDGEPTVESP